MTTTYVIGIDTSLPADQDRDVSITSACGTVTLQGPFIDWMGSATLRDGIDDGMGLEDSVAAADALALRIADGDTVAELTALGVDCAGWFEPLPTAVRNETGLRPGLTAAACPAGRGSRVRSALPHINHRSQIMDHILYAAAKAAITTEIEANTARLDRAVAETGAALIAALRAAITTALPARSDGTPHELQPLADLMADGAKLGGTSISPFGFDAESLALFERAAASTAHALTPLQPSVIRGRVYDDLYRYANALAAREAQARRLAD